MIVLTHGETGVGDGLLTALTFVVWIPALALWLLMDRRAGRIPARGWVAATAWTSLGAGLIHLVVTPEHWDEAVLYGAFFLGTTIVQVGLAVALPVRPTRLLVAGNVVVQLALVALWAVTRTAGIPLGPEAGEVEAVGALDVICVVLEVLSAGAGLVLLRRTGAPRRAGLPAAG
jgi:hypothetical protein